MNGRILIYGAGSLGTALGAFLSREGKDVTLCSRNSAHVAALREQGAVLSGKAELRQKVKACTPEELTGRYELIWLLTKQTENAQTAEFLKDHLAEDGLLITGQNGIPEPGLAEILGVRRVAGASVAWGARYLGPGQVELTAKPESFAFGMGVLPGGDKEKLKKAQELLGMEYSGPVAEGLLGLRWSKLIINAAFTGLGSCFGMTFGEVAKNRRTRELALESVKECVRVCRAAGIKMAPVQGLDVEKLFWYEGAVKKAVAMAIVPIAMKKHGATWPSMLQDMEKGKRSEVREINGLVCRWGEEWDVPTPIHRRIVEVVEKEERGEIPWHIDNLRYFEAF